MTSPHACLEVRLVVSDSFAEYFANGGGFLPSNRLIQSPSSSSPPVSAEHAARPMPSTSDVSPFLEDLNAATVVQYPHSCTTEAASLTDATASRRNRTCFVARYQPVDDGDVTPRQLCLLIGRDPNSTHAVVKHALAAGPLLSRRQCCLTLWFSRVAEIMHGKEGTDVPTVVLGVADLGSMNGTFVDSKRTPRNQPGGATGMGPPMVVRGSSLQGSSMTPRGVWVCDLSFGSGAKVEDGGTLDAASEKLRIAVFVKLVAPQQPNTTPAVLKESVKSLFRVPSASVPIRGIEQASAMPRSATTASDWGASSAASLVEQPTTAVAPTSSGGSSRGIGVDGTTRPDDGPLTMLPSASVASMVAAPSSSNARSPNAAEGSRLLLAARSSGALSPAKSRGRLPTNEVLTGILKDHGFVSPEVQRSPPSPSAPVAAVNHPRSVPPLSTIQEPVPVITLETGSITKESLEMRSSFVLQADAGVQPSIPIVQQAYVVSALAPEPQLPVAPVTLHGAHRPESPQFPCSPEPPAPEARPAMSLPYEEMPDAVLLCRPSKGATPVPQPSHLSTAHVAEVAKDRTVFPESHHQLHDITMMSQPISFPSSQQHISDEKPLNPLEAVDVEPEANGGLLTRSKKVTAIKTEPGKNRRTKQRITDPKETVARFCEELRSNAPASDASAAAAMAKSIRAGLQCAAELSAAMPATRIPPESTLQRVIEREDVNDDDDDDVPLGKLLQQAAASSTSSLPPPAAPNSLPPVVVTLASASQYASAVMVDSDREGDANSLVLGSFQIRTIHDEINHDDEPPAVFVRPSRAPLVIPPPAGEGSSYQLSDFVEYMQHPPTIGRETASQTTAGSKDAPLSPRCSARDAGGFKIIAGRTDPSLVVPLSLGRNLTCPAPQPSPGEGFPQVPLLRATQRRETLKCLFDDDEGEDDDDVSLVRQKSLEDVTERPAAHGNFVLGAIQSLAELPPADNEVAPQDECGEPEPLKSHQCPRSVGQQPLQDASCASWSFTQGGDFVLVASQAASGGAETGHEEQDRARSSSQWSQSSNASLRQFASQTVLTRRPGAPLLWLGRSAHPPHQPPPPAATAVKRVQFNKHVTTVHLTPPPLTLPLDDDVAASKRLPRKRDRSPESRPNPKKRGGVAAARAKLETVLHMLPAALNTEAKSTQSNKGPTTTLDSNECMDGQSLMDLKWKSGSADGLIAAEHGTILDGVVYAPPAAACLTERPYHKVYCASDALRSVLKPHQWDGLRFLWSCLLRAADEATQATDDSTFAAAAAAKRSPSAYASALSSKGKDLPTGVSRSSGGGRRIEGHPRVSSVFRDMGATIGSGDEEDDTAIGRTSTRYDFGGPKDTEETASEESMDDATPRGCILAHAMGLGKTLTTLSLLFTVWRYISLHPSTPIPCLPRSTTASLKVVVCVPKSLVFHWVREAHRWTTELGEDAVTVYLVSSDSRSDKLDLLKEWAAEPVHARAILVTTHTTFTSVMLSDQLPNAAAMPEKPRRGSASRRKQSKSKKGNSVDADGDDGEDVLLGIDSGAADDDDVTEMADDDMGGAAWQLRVDRLRQCRGILLQHTDILIVDEAHKFQRPDSRLSRAACMFRSPRFLKLAITGTPVTSAHRDELLAILQFVLPSVWTKRDLSDKGIAAELHRLVHHRGLEVLAAELPPIVEHTITVKFSPVQQQLFQALIASHHERGVVPSKKLLDVVHKTLLISNHCDLVADWCRRKLSATGTSLDAVSEPSWQVSKAAAMIRWALPSLDVPSMFAPRDNEEEQDEDPAIASLDHSWKMRVLLAILHRSLSVGERVVVFSRSIKTLFLVGQLLLSLGLVDGENFALLDGRVPTTVRDDCLARFNEEQQQRDKDTDENDAGTPEMTTMMKVLLLSSASCSVGIHVTGAQRVILMEASWRPMLELQAICRVFRYGQRHPVFVNRLVSLNGIEERLLAGLNGSGSSANYAAAASNNKSPKPSAADNATEDSEALQRVLGPQTADTLIASCVTKSVSGANRLSASISLDPVLAETLAGATMVHHVTRGNLVPQSLD